MKTQILTSQWRHEFYLSLIGLFAIAGLAFSSTVFADDATGCKNPTWAPQPMPGFVIDSCEHKAWDMLDYDLPGGEKALAGARTSVTYELKDPAKNPTDAAARDYFIAAGKKAGATLMSDPTASWRAVLTQKTPQGEFWYVYDHGSGSDTETDSYTLTTLKITPFKQVVVAQLPTGSLTGVPGQGCKPPPWLVKQFDYYKFSDCTQHDYDALTLDLPDGSKTIAGHYLDVNYQLTDESKDSTALYLKKNYVNALEKIGAKLVSDPDNIFQAVLTQKTADGEFWYIYNHGSGNEESTSSYSLVSLQVGGPPPKTCKIEVYGVNFDFDKSDIKPESEPVLTQLLALFRADPNYSAEVGGHTDNVGKDAYNMSLSDRRAAAVRTWLIAHGVESSRLTSHGYGDTVPLVPNNSDANRARNRRVELKKRNCK